MSDPSSAARAQFERLAAALADRYHLERELAAGGMATVYLAEDVKLDRKVAVKVLKPELAVAIGAERFLAEITTTAALPHPHILALHDSGAKFPLDAVAIGRGVVEAADHCGHARRHGADRGNTASTAAVACRARSICRSLCAVSPTALK